MNRKDAKKRIQKLKDEIEHHRYLYHVLDREEISDGALDSLKHELFNLEQQFPELVTPDSPTQRVGGEPLPQFEKWEHKELMLSIEDVFSEKEFLDWQKRIQKLVPESLFDYYAEIKMDGLAVSLIYKKGIFSIGATRGDGKIGENVTQNLSTIEAIPLKLRKPKENEVRKFIEKFKDNLDVKKFHKKIFDLGGTIEIRGEIFMKKNDFLKLNKRQEKNKLPLFANPRNVAAGSIRQLDSKITASRNLDFFGYALVSDLGQKTHEQGHEILKLLGVKVNPENRCCVNHEEVFSYYRSIAKKRSKFPYWCDGVVVNVNSDKVFDKLGMVGKTRRGMVAYKFPAEEATTTVREVNWQVGRTGAITPVAIMDPVSIGGSTVTHATLHNPDEIKRLGVKLKDTVIIQKAGDIIPKIIKVLPKLRSGDEKNIVIPKKCPKCESKLLNKPGEVAIYCSNKDCFARSLKNIKHFVSKKAMNIDGLGDKIIEKLLDEGLIKDVADLYELKIVEIIPLERFSDKSASNLIKAIEKSKKIPLARFLYSLGIRHIGEETAIDLANNFGSIEKIKSLTVEKLERVPDVGNIMAKSIEKWFSEEKNSILINRLLGHIELVRPKVKNKVLKGEKFVLTGTLDAMTRETAKEKIRDLGGEISSSVSKESNFLIAGNNAGSKYEKASKLGVKILNEKEFLKMINKN